MDEEGEYSDGEIVWVKLSYCWWPGEVLAGNRLTEEFLSTLKRRPLAVVKFFEEDSYEYVKNTNFIYKYNCNRKNEFLRKGLEQYRAKNKHMIKFPADVMQAERATGGDPNIVNSQDFLPQKRESYADIFSPDKSKGKGKAAASTPRSTGKKPPVSPSKTIAVIPVRKHEVRILAQASTSSGIAAHRGGSLTSTPRSANNSTLNASSLSGLESDGGGQGSSSTASPSSQIYHCHKCGFESSRQNVIVLHTKHCRAVPLVPFNIPAVRESKALQSATVVVKAKEDPPPSAAPKATPAESPKDPEEEELVEVLQVVETKATPGRASRTPRAAVAATSTPSPKVDRRRNRGRGKAAAVVAEAVAAAQVAAVEDDEKMEVLMEVAEEGSAAVPVDEPVQEVVKSLDDSTGKDSKGKADVELKNELLADWSEDEQDEQELRCTEDKGSRKAASIDEVDKAVKVEQVAPAVTVVDTNLEKSVESSPQLASPVSSGTTIKYRNIPKKQKREYIEVTNDQPALPVSTTIEKSSSESSISTAATCGGEALSGQLDKAASTSSSSDSQPERPISAKQRILDRATRGSSKSSSSDDLKPEPSTAAGGTVATTESQPGTDDETKKETSCFDFKEEEEEEVVLSKSPRRSLSNRRDVSLDAATSALDAAAAKEQEEQLEQRAKKDAELKNEIDSLLCEVSVPSLPELPKLTAGGRASSPGPSCSSTETTPQSKEEIDRNRTLPPKERGKRIFKTRNKIIENEAIALEQSKAIVLDFVKRSHEEELAQQKEQDAKLSSESPTTTNDDSQESLASNEPARFENSEFAAIKAKRTKLPPAEVFPDPVVVVVAAAAAAPAEDKELPEESTVSSSNESKPEAEPESLPVSISKDQLALETLDKVPPSAGKGRKGRQQQQRKPTTIVSPIVLLEKLGPEHEPAHVEEQATPKARKKRAGEMDQLDLSVLDTPRSRRGRSTKTEEPAAVVVDPVVEVVEPPQEAEPPVEKARRHKRSKKEEEPEPEETPAPEETPSEPKPAKVKRSKHSATQQQSADSTADLPSEPAAAAAAEPVVPTASPEPPTVSITPKQQPIKMIIKSKGRKSNSELICEPVIVAPPPQPKQEEAEPKVPAKSPKSSKRKKEEPVAEPAAAEVPVPVAAAKSPKSKRPKFRNEPVKVGSGKPVEPAAAVATSEGPSATDLQIAEALIHLPEAAVPPKVDVVLEQQQQELVEVKSNNSSPVPINPRKRHLQTLMGREAAVETAAVEQPKPADVNAVIPEKKKRETIEVVSVAPATIVLDKPSVTNVVSAPPMDEDKFDIDNIPIVMDDSELLEDATISTTSGSVSRKTSEVPPPAPAPLVVPAVEEVDDGKLISTSKPMTKKLMIVKSSNGSAKIVARKEHLPVPKKNLGIKSTTITIKPPTDQLSPNSTRSPAHSPPIRSAHLVQASSGGQIVITSKGTVLTTQSPATSSAKSHMSAGPKTHVTQSSSKTTAGIVSSVVSSAGSISSSTYTKTQVESPTRSPTTTTERSAATATAIKSPAKICVQSQEIIHPPTKPRSVATGSPVVVQKAPPKKGAAKKQAEPGSSGGKPLFATSKGAFITPQPATSSAVTPGKKGHRVIKISPQKLKEFTRLGMVEDKGQGKVLTASGMKKFRQEQQLLQQQQSPPPPPKPDIPSRRADSVDEEPSTSTPTPPPPSDIPAEVVVAAAADSSVKELPVSTPDEEEQSTEAAEATVSETAEVPESSSEVSAAEVAEENEADAAVNETEPESSTSQEESFVAADPTSEEAVESASESAPAAPEAPIEPSESGSNVQESSQLIAVPAENFGGPANLFYLCSVREEGFVPVNNELLYLDSSNQLVALPEQASVEDIVNQAEMVEIPAGSEQATVVTAAGGDVEGVVESGQQNILLNTQDGQQIILDQQSLMALAAGGDTSQLLTPDGQQILLQGSILTTSDSVDEIDPEMA